MPGKRAAAAQAAQARMTALMGSPIFEQGRRTGRRLRSTWGQRWRSALVVVAIITADALAVAKVAELPARQEKRWPLVLFALGILAVFAWVQRRDRRLLTIVAALLLPIMLLSWGLYASAPSLTKPMTRQAGTVSVMSAGAWTDTGGGLLAWAGDRLVWVGKQAASAVGLGE